MVDLALGGTQMLPNTVEQFRRIIRQIGSCPFCTRKAFLAMAASWIVTAAIMTISDLPTLSLTSLVIAATLTALWASHLVAYANRISTKTMADDVQRYITRRNIIPLYAKILAAAAITSMIPKLAFAGSCSTSCPNGSSSNTCPGSQTCSCHCDGRGDATCGSCS